MRLILLSPLLLFIACKAPRPKYLTRDGGEWNIEALHYTRDGGPDTTFLNCGVMHFEMEQDEEKNEDTWDVEGYVTAPEEVDSAGGTVFIWSTFWFNANVRTGMEIQNEITWWNFTEQTWKVTKREKDYMEWSWTNWDGDIRSTYKLRRK